MTTRRVPAGPADARTAAHGAGAPCVGDCLEQAIRAWPSVRAREWTHRAAEDLCADSAILAVVALGSAVRSADAPQDIDLLVVYRQAHPKLGPVPLDVDVRAYDADTVQEKIAAGHDLLGWAVNFGLLLCERETYWSRLRMVWAGRIPLPSAEQAQERAARARRLTQELREAGDLEAAAEQYVSWLTHDARARLIRAGVYPASRPELPAQLLGIGERSAAEALESALAERAHAHR